MRVRVSIMQIDSDDQRMWALHKKVRVDSTGKFTVRFRGDKLAFIVPEGTLRHFKEYGQRGNLGYFVNSPFPIDPKTYNSPIDTKMLRMVTDTSFLQALTVPDSFLTWFKRWFNYYWGYKIAHYRTLRRLKKSLGEEVEDASS